MQQYQINVDPNRLRGFNRTLGDVVHATQQSNANVGGNVIESNGMWSIVRGVGLVRSAEDLVNLPVGAANGVPVFVLQVAAVHVGDAFRVASLGKQEAVGGVVVARASVHTRRT